MSSLVFNLDDCRLTSEEKRRLLELSNNLHHRPFERLEMPSAYVDPGPTITTNCTPPIPDPRTLEAQHHRLDRGDL